MAISPLQNHMWIYVARFRNDSCDPPGKNNTALPTYFKTNRHVATLRFNRGVGVRKDEGTNVRKIAARTLHVHM